MVPTRKRQPKQRMNAKQRFSCGVGSLLNDFYRQLGISFLISFLMKVVGLPAYQAGVALLIAQFTDAFISPINGFLGDHVKIPLISNKMGRRKSWHLVGTALMTVALPLLFNRCLLCDEHRDTSRLPLAYYGCIIAVVNIAYNMIEINHLSIISSVTETIREATALNALRTVFSFVTGIYVYLIAWGLLGQDSGDDLGPDSLNQFAHLSWISTGTGVIFAIIFYIGTKEPENSRPLRKISTLMDPVNAGGLISASQSIYSMVFDKADGTKKESTTLAQTFIEILMSTAKSEESVNEEGNETEESEARQRKKSLLQRFVTAIFANEDESNHACSSGEKTLPEVREEGYSDRPADLITQVEKLDRDRKKSLVVRFIDGLVHLTQTATETPAVTSEEDENEGGKDDEHQADYLAGLQDFNGGNGTERMEEDSESILETEHTGERIRQRRNGLTISLEDLSELGIPNLGYQNEGIAVENPCESFSETDAVSNTLQIGLSRSPGRKKSRRVSFLEGKHECDSLQVGDSIDLTSVPEAIGSSEEVNPETTRKVSFFDEQHDFERIEREEELNNATREPDHGKSSEEKSNETTSDRLATTEKFRKVSFFDEQDNYETEEAHEEAIDVASEPEPPSRSLKKRKPKTTRDWLIDPHLYKIAVIVTCSRLVQDAVYAYLPLYLTERMGFGKQAIAYFPLVLLVSAALASTISDKLNSKIGSKLTYLLASLLVIGGSVYCYFQSPSMRQSTYAPVIMIGSGMSIMYVMALAFATEFIGDDTETSGSAFSVIVIIARLSSGGLFMAIQEFYPEDNAGSNADISDYVRHVLSIVPGILALTGFLLVLFFQPSLLCCTTKELPTEEVADETEASSTSFEVVVIPD